jgi:hypothetical protein
MFGSKMAKSVKAACASIMLLLVVTPVKSLLSGDIPDFEIDEYECEVDGNFLSYVSGESYQPLVNCIKDCLSARGIKGADVSVRCAEDGRFEIEAVEIFLPKTVIDENGEHINISVRIKEWISQETGIEKDRVIVYEKGNQHSN